LDISKVQRSVTRFIVNLSARTMFENLIMKMTPENIYLFQDSTLIDSATKLRSEIIKVLNPTKRTK